jgi:prophage maintenance system killer protein
MNGNKRAAFAVMSTFLAINGIEITAATEAIYAFIAECYAVNSFGFAQLLQWLRENTAPA